MRFLRSASRDRERRLLLEEAHGAIHLPQRHGLLEEVQRIVVVENL